MEIFDIKKLKEEATDIISIPNFKGNGMINVRVQRPRIISMAAQGKIPNPLMGIATELIKKGVNIEDAKLKESSQMFELYCRVCMVEPTFEEMKDYITDDQMVKIFQYAIGGLNAVEPFRKDKEDGTDNNTSTKVSKKTK